jgi:hypothetical protein
VSDTYLGHYVLNSSFKSIARHGNSITTGVITSLTGPDDYDYGCYVYEYDGTTGTGRMAGMNYDYGRCVSYRTYSTLDTTPASQRLVPGNALIGNYPPADGRAATPYTNLLASGHYYGYREESGAPGDFGHLVDINLSSDLAAANVVVGGGVAGFGQGSGVDAPHMAPRGAWRGKEVDFVNNAGNLFVAADGATPVQKATWQIGVVEQSKLIGGGPLVWLARNVSANNELIRISTDGGTTWIAMTGNFWSIASGEQHFIDLGLVF